MPIFSETLTENAHRYYPFDPTTSTKANPVPTTLFLDLGILAAPGLPTNGGTDTTYISKLVTDGVQLRVYMAADIDDDTLDFGCVAVIDVTNEVGVRTDFRYAGQGIVFEGFIVTGDTTVTKDMPPILTLSAAEGRLYTGCIYLMSSWLCGLQVDNVTLSGVVNLKAGTGIHFDVDTETNSITISYVPSARYSGLSSVGDIDVEGDIVINPSEFMDYLVEHYGMPITAINGVPAGGGWIIAADEDSGLTVSTDRTTSTIKIINQNASACCTQDELSTLVDNLAALNTRVTVLNEFTSQLETNINVVSTQLAKI